MERGLDSRSSVVRSGRGRPRKGQVSRAAQKLEWIVEDIGRAAGLVSEVVVKNGWRKMEEWRKKEKGLRTGNRMLGYSHWIFGTLCLSLSLSIVESKFNPPSIVVVVRSCVWGSQQQDVLPGLA